MRPFSLKAARLVAIGSALSVSMLGGGAARALPLPCESTDAGNVRGSAQPIETPGLCTGTLNGTPEDRADYYSFPVSAGAQVAVSAVSAPPGATLELFDNNGSNRCAAGANACQAGATGSGTWVAGITGGAASIDYVLAIAVAGPNDVAACEATADAGETMSTATPLPMTDPGETTAACRGSIFPAFSDMGDWYTFRVHSATSALELIAQPGNGEDVDVFLIGPDGVAKDPAVLGGVSQADVFQVATPAKGTWTIGILPGRNRTTATYNIGLALQEG